jgi:hypothetical protein
MVSDPMPVLARASLLVVSMCACGRGPEPAEVGPAPTPQLEESSAEATLAAGIPNAGATPALAEDAEPVDSSASIAVDPKVRRAAHVLAGLGAEATGRDEQHILDRHAYRVEKAWVRLERELGGPMMAWSAEHLDQSVETVFYPFSGPDFVAVHRLYPKADHYVLVAMQRGGRVPQVDGLRNGTLKKRLRAYSSMAEAISTRGFFITNEMHRVYEKRGITGQLILFAEREGFDVLDVEPMRITDAGQLGPDERSRKRFDSVRLHLRRRADQAAVTLDYVRANLSNRGIRNTPGLKPWLSSITKVPVVAKAASHLMQQPNFTAIRDLILANAPTVVQDETALPYTKFARHFDVALYGEFSTVNSLFHQGPQQALARAYARTPSIDDVPFSFGYTKRSGRCIQVGTAREG